MKKLIKFFSDNWKIVMIASLLFISIIVFWKVVRALLVKLGIMKLPVLSVNSFNLSKSMEEISVISDYQYSAMNRLGTKDALLFNSISDLNVDDLKAVYNTFGIRKYDRWKGSKIIGDNLDLLQWYKEELSPAEKTKMRDIWKVTGLFLPF